jgi:hypothetical protein
MDGIERARFDHIGVITEEPQPGEVFVDATRVWVTSPRAHPFHVEYLRYEPDTTVEGPVRNTPHVAYRVDDVHAAIAGHELLLGPFEVGGGFAQVAFVLIDNAVVEFMQYANADEEGWF